MGTLHNRFATPVNGVVLMVIISAIIGSIGVVGGVVALTGIILSSNLGTFILDALICAITFIASAVYFVTNSKRQGKLIVPPVSVMPKK